MRRAWTARTREFEIKDHELRLLQDQTRSSDASRVLDQIDVVVDLSHMQHIGTLFRGA